MSLKYSFVSRLSRFAVCCVGVVGSICTATALAQPLPITIASTDTEKTVDIATELVIGPVAAGFDSSSEDPTAAPFFSLEGGTYNTPQTLTLTDSTPGARIYYTTNGFAPSTASTLYTGPISISATELVRAVAIAPGYSVSKESSKSYTFVVQPLAASPYFSLAGGSYNTPQTLTLTDSTPGATIYYTTDGTMPTTASTPYTGPITIKTSELVTAIAAAPSYANSNSSSKRYSIED